MKRASSSTSTLSILSAPASNIHGLELKLWSVPPDTFRKGPGEIRSPFLLRWAYIPLPGCVLSSWAPLPISVCKIRTVHTVLGSARKIWNLKKNKWSTTCTLFSSYLILKRAWKQLPVHWKWDRQQYPESEINL